MKKILALCLCTGMAVTFCGCSLGNIVEQFTSTGDLSAGETSPAEALQEVKTRVYMDEISGKLEGFTGNTLTLSADKNTYCFDISQASLECKNGIITGDEISVIYEGQLTDTDTSTVKALKVVDEFHKKTKLKVQTVQGTLQNLTSNTITIKSGKGKALTYPITGTEQYYQNGLKAGNQVFLKYKGKDPSDKKAVDSSLDAGHLKVLSISDMKEFKAQKASPMPTPGAEDPTVSKQFLATVQDIKLNILEVIPAGKSVVQSIDLSAIPSWFRGGIAPGSHVNVTYSGEFKDDTLSGITVLAVTGEDPEKITDRNISFTVSGSVIGSTANTVTIQTTDGAVDTFRMDSASDSSTGGLETGCQLCITFHPSRSITSNIYEAVKIEDA